MATADRPSHGAIVLLTGNHICHNPRAFKEATALAQAGYEVEVLGAWTDPELRARDRDLIAASPFRFTPVLDHASGSAKRWDRVAGRVHHALARRLPALGADSLFGYATSSLLRAARLRSPRLFIAHSEAGLKVACALAETGAPVGIDFEDWYSEDLLPEDRRLRPVRRLQDLERAMLRICRHASSTSHAMSEALARRHGCAPPVVVYNAFPWAERDGRPQAERDRPRRDGVSIHWFSQTLGPGRGLEELVAALRLMKGEPEVHLRGRAVPAFREWIARNAKGRVHFHDLVGNEELPARIREHDVGFAGEVPFCPSRDLTVTNKILQYLLGGLAVVASATSGQAEVARAATGAVFTYPPGDAAALARELDRLCASPEALTAAKARALEHAQNTFCWERQVPTLVASVSNAVRATTPAELSDAGR